MTTLASVQVRDLSVSLSLQNNFTECHLNDFWNRSITIIHNNYYGTMPRVFSSEKFKLFSLLLNGCFSIDIIIIVFVPSLAVHHEKASTLAQKSLPSGLVRHKHDVLSSKIFRLEESFFQRFKDTSNINNFYLHLTSNQCRNCPLFGSHGGK